MATKTSKKATTNKAAKAKTAPAQTKGTTTTLKDALRELESLGNEGVRAQNAKSGPFGDGAGDNQFGVALGDIRTVAKKIKTMPTDPARVKRTDRGNPEKCPVWDLHKIYSDAERREWVVKGCTTAGIGCLECKQPVIDAINRELAPIRARAQTYVDDPALAKNIVADGCDKARKLAQETMRDAREALGLAYP